MASASAAAVCAAICRNIRGRQHARGAGRLERFAPPGEVVQQDRQRKVRDRVLRLARLVESLADEWQQHVVAQRNHLCLERDLGQMLGRATAAGETAAVGDADGRLVAEAERDEHRVDRVLQDCRKAVVVLGRQEHERVGGADGRVPLLHGRRRERRVVHVADGREGLPGTSAGPSRGGRAPAARNRRVSSSARMSHGATRSAARPSRVLPMMSLTCSMLNVPFVVVPASDAGVVRTRTTSKDETGCGKRDTCSEEVRRSRLVGCRARPAFSGRPAHGSR